MQKGRVLMSHLLKREMCGEFRRRLEEEEKSTATVKKYVHDVKMFLDYVGEGREITKKDVMAYKEYLILKYAAASVNSMLAAVNVFLKAQGWYDCVVKELKMQKIAFRAGEREMTKQEYRRLLEAAEKKGNLRLSLVMQTLAATGIRVSELKYITAEALQTGRAQVYSKGKLRMVLLAPALCRKLKKYVGTNGIQSGSIFTTRTGKALDRSNIYHEMKALCETAGVGRKKIFPHNLRHLFAVTYYNVEKDISHLSDLLGHSSVNTTRIYTLVSSEEHTRQIENLGLVV